MDESDMNVFEELSRVLKGPEKGSREYLSSGLTYGQLYDLASGLRAELQKPSYQGVCLCLATDDKGLLAAGILAALGGDQQLLLPFSLQGRALEKIISETGVKSVIGHELIIRGEGVELLNPATLRSTLKQGKTDVHLHHELLRIYTGGSTGSPQIWSKTVGNIFSEAFFLSKAFNVTEKDTILSTVPPNHIYGLLFTVILPLVSGATVVSEVPQFPAEISQKAEEHGATLLVSVPPHYRGLKNTDLSMRLAFSSAGMLEKEDNQHFCARNGVPIVEVYGSTETGGVASRNRFRKEETFTPFPTLDWRIIDECLAVRSPYISPDLGVDSDGYFRTNDRVKSDDNTTFSLLGRIDNIVKIGGKRVDLDEIRAILLKEPGVEDCVVLPTPQPGGRGHRIDALLQATQLDLGKVKEVLADSLEHYAIPRTIKRVEQIPTKDNGKYDWLRICQLLAP